MANFRVYGMDKLQAEMRQMGEVPREATEEILTAMATVSMEEQVKVAKEMGVYDRDNEGKHVIDSIGLTKPKITDDGGKISVTYKGKRKDKNHKTPTSNAEIAFVNNYGRKGKNGKGKIEPRPFVRTANTRAADRMQEAGQAAWDKWKNNQGG